MLFTSTTEEKLNKILWDYLKFDMKSDDDLTWRQLAIF